MTKKQNTSIKIEWTNQHGGESLVSRKIFTDMEMYECSERALNSAMNTIKAMALKVSHSMDSLTNTTRPDEVEMEFGINLEIEAGALLAKASSSAQLNVKLKWNKIKDKN